MQVAFKYVQREEEKYTIIQLYGAKIWHKLKQKEFSYRYFLHFSLYMPKWWTEPKPSADDKVFARYTTRNLYIQTDQSRDKYILWQIHYILWAARRNIVSVDVWIPNFLQMIDINGMFFGPLTKLLQDCLDRMMLTIHAW